MKNSIMVSKNLFYRLSNHALNGLSHEISKYEVEDPTVTLEILKKRVSCVLASLVKSDSTTRESGDTKEYNATLVPLSPVTCLTTKSGGTLSCGTIMAPLPPKSYFPTLH